MWDPLPACIRVNHADRHAARPGPYLQYVQSLSKKFKHLEYLALWMLVGCAPPKWRFVKNEPNSRQERIARTNVCAVDYNEGTDPVQSRCTTTRELKVFLEAAEPQQPEIRLVVVEDLSRDVVEMLGAHYDIDPLFFVSHIGDYLFHNILDRWVELPDLEVDAKKRPHFNLQYLRPRYFQSEQEFAAAEKESGIFNVLRRIDSDRSRRHLQLGLLNKPGASVTLSRAKTSLWIKPRAEGEPIVAVLLVDPSVKAGHAVWGGYRPFEATPSMKEWKDNVVGNGAELPSPPRTSLFEDVIYWSCRMTAEDLQIVKAEPRYIALPMYKLVIADWLVVLKYMTSMFGLIEWSFAKPHWGEQPSDIDDLLKKLAPWRRNMPYYQQMAEKAIVRLFPSVAAAHPTMSANRVVSAPDTTSGINSLWTDFKHVKQQIDDHKNRIESIQTMATNAINTEEARHAVKQNRNLARLSFLATFFIPLNFTSSFLSMSPDFPTSQSYTTIWIFFVLGIPITVLAFIIVDWTKPNKRGITRRAWIKYFGEKTEAVEAMDPHPGIKKRSRTIGTWPFYGTS